MKKDVDLVDSAHTLVKELSGVRKSFIKGTVKNKQARNIIGIYNVSCRSIDTSIRAERFVNTGK